MLWHHSPVLVQQTNLDDNFENSRSDSNYVAQIEGQSEPTERCLYVYISQSCVTY